MNLLLDSHILLWWFGASPRLNESSLTKIATADRIFVSAATVWEFEIKRAIGKLDPPEDVVEALNAEGFVALDITPEDGARAGRLPKHHADPFDRMIVAQAIGRELTLMTADRHLVDYEAAVLFVG